MTVILHQVCVSHRPDIYRQYLGGDHRAKQYPITLYDNRVENVAIPLRYNNFIDNVLPGLPDCWIVFVHHDVVFYEDPSIVLDNLDKDVIYGPAGTILVPGLVRYYAAFDGYWPRIVRYQHHHRRSVGQIRCAIELAPEGVVGNPIGQPELVDTLDCCCLIVHSTLIRKYGLRFDPAFAWHLYSEDFSMSALQEHGIRSKAINLNCGHYGLSTTTNEAFKTHLSALLDKYSGIHFASTCYAPTIDEHPLLCRIHNLPHLSWSVGEVLLTLRIMIEETFFKKKITFDETAYLETYPDVAHAVKCGVFKSGYQHYRKNGQFEGRTIRRP